MSILTIFVPLIVVGILLYLVNTFIPMDRNIKKIVNIVAVVIVILWLIKIFGLVSYLSGIHI